MWDIYQSRLCNGNTIRKRKNKEEIFEVIMAENFKLTHDTKCGAGGIKRNTNPDTPQ